MKDKIELQESLIQCLYIQTETFKQEKMISYVESKLDSLKIKYEKDKNDNIIVNRVNNAPYVVAHMDTVHSLCSNPSIYITKNNNLFMMDSLTTSQIGIGGDDKVGVWAVLETLEEIKDVNAVFFSNEERGFVGSNAIDLSKINNANWFIQLDRRNNNDFICGDMSSDEFQKDCEDVYKKYNYTFLKTQTTATDVARLIDRQINVSAVNISCGYYNPHSSKEYVNIDDAINALYLTIDLINKIGKKKYEFIQEKKYYQHSYGNYSGGFGNNYTYGYQNNSKESPESKIKSLLKTVCKNDDFIYSNDLCGIISISPLQKIEIEKLCFSMYKETLTNIILKIKEKQIQKLLLLILNSK